MLLSKNIIPLGIVYLPADTLMLENFCLVFRKNEPTKKVLKKMEKKNLK